MKHTSFGWWLGLGNISWEKNSRSESFFGLMKQGIWVKSISTTHQNRQKKDGRLGRVVIWSPKIQAGKKPMRISSQPPRKRVEVAPVNLVNCGWWLQTIRHIFSAEFWFEPHRRINPPTLKSPTSLGLIGERWSNYLKFALKTYSTICWWSSQKNAQWQFTSNDFFHWDVLGSEKMVQGATNYNLNIPRFLRGLSLNYKPCTDIWDIAINGWRNLQWAAWRLPLACWWFRYPAFTSWGW